MICVRPEGKAARQETPNGLFIINVFLSYFIDYRQNTKMSLMLVLRFQRVTLEDLCSACSIWCGFRLALPFLVERCDRSNYPEIYSRVSDFQRWIKNEVTGA